MKGIYTYIMRRSSPVRPLCELRGDRATVLEVAQRRKHREAAALGGMHTYAVQNASRRLSIDYLSSAIRATFCQSARPPP